MALRTIQERIHFPARLGLASKSAQLISGNPFTAEGANSLLDGQGEKHQQVGIVQWEDGSSGLTVQSVSFRVGTVTTNLSGANTIRVGVQSVTTSGTTRLGNGTWRCYGETSADLTADSGNSVTMTTQTQVVSHGDTIAVVVEMLSWTNANFNVSVLSGGTTHNDPSVVNAGGGTYAGIPCVQFTATTGQRGILAGGAWVSSYNEYRFDNAGTTLPAATAYTEYGNNFQVPFRCRATGFWFIHRPSNSSVTLEANLYRGSISAPGSSIKSLSGGVDVFGPSTTSARLVQTYFSPITIEKDTNYIATIKATGADDHRLPVLNQGYTGNILPGGPNTYSVYRTGTGAFTATATEWIPMGLIIDQIDDSSGNWAPGSGTTGNTLYVEADPSAAGATGVSGAVFASPDGSDLVGPKIGEFTGENFEAALVDGKAVLKVAVSAFGGTGLLLADTPVVLLRNSEYTTGFVPATVINE